ncbi:4Fe-4S dicluster domain-containing protein [Chloroflexota bacterium]
MEEKVIVFNPVLCTGCMRCMTTCTTYNFGATSLSKSRIQIVRHEGHAITRMDEEDNLIFQPLVCQQCDKPHCLNACPVKAISEDKETLAKSINYDKCIGCRLCMIACPFGAMRYDPLRKKVYKCELCEGDPQCVKLCPTEALLFMPKEVANTVKIAALSQKLIKAQSEPLQ